MGLGLKSDPYMFDGRAEEGISDTSKCAGGIVLAIAEVWGRGSVEVGLLELATCVVEGAELDGDAGANANERGEGAFVECERAFVGEDLAGAIKGGGILRCGLETDFDDIYMLLRIAVEWELVV